MRGLKERQITVVIKEPGRRARVEYLFDNTLDALQKAVGGRIETVTIASDLVFICNADGRNEGLPFNVRLFDVDFYGTILIVGAKEDEFTSLNTRLLDDLLYRLGF